MKKLFIFFLLYSSLVFGQSGVIDKPADITPTSDDLIYTVNDPAGTPGGRKVTLGNVPKALLSGITNGYLLYNNNGVFGSPTIVTPLSATNGSVSVAGLSSLGTATYMTRVNAGGTAWEYRSPSQVLSDIGALTSTIPGSSTELLFRNSSTSLGATTVTWDNGAGTLTTSGNIKLSNSGSASELQLLEPTGNGINYTAFKAQAQAGNVTYTLPASDGTATYQLSTDGSGNLSWTQPAYSGSYAVDADISGITGTPRAFVSGNNAIAFNNVSAAMGANAYGTGLHAFKTRSASGVDANTIINNDDTIAEFVGYGADGANYLNAARILFKVDGTPGSGDMPGAILFDVTADGANSPTRILKLGSNGHASLGGGTSASELRFLEPTGSGANYTAFKAQAQAGDVTYTLPAADGTSGYQLTTNGSGTLSWAAAGSGGLTKFTEAESTSSPNGTVYVDSLTAAASSTNADAAIVPKGTGALLAAIPDSGTTGGNKRGANAVDLQTKRNSASQVASGDSSVISGGEYNTASGVASVVGGGTANSATGSYAAVGGGASNTASGAYSIASGSRAVASLHGEHTQASGHFSSVGDAQTSVLVARNTTTNGLGGTSLRLDGSSERLTIPANTAWQAQISIVARHAATGDCASWTFTCLITRDGSNNTTIPGSTSNMPVQTDYSGSGSAWTISVTADNTNEALQIGVTGESGKTIKWVARVELTEVTG